MAETPPRAWGRQYRVYDGEVLEGNTPTGVGKTPSVQLRRLLDEKHPHGRGEDAFAIVTPSTPRETPPRAWGRHNLKSSDWVYKGNTPTGVGKTGYGVDPIS